MFDDDEFECAGEVRWKWKGRGYGSADKLQQKWRKPTYNEHGYLLGWEIEWRDVPRLID
jgi:hypothetical protein